jgi:hypothetical protein
MDINPQATSTISDDQELAKVLAGVNQQNDEPLQFETTPILTTPAPVAPTEPVVPQMPIAAPAPEEPTMPTPMAAPASDLDSIKSDALRELRPLVDKLDLAPEEKFDTYLLLLRSTDDKTLIAPAHLAAQSITDETRKAQALLDIIKEIDYFSAPKQ